MKIEKFINDEIKEMSDKKIDNNSNSKSNLSEL